MKKMIPGRKRGFTMMEMVLYIAIGLALLASGFYAYQQAKASSDLTDKTRQVVSISTEIRAQYRTAADFSGLSGSSALQNLMDGSGLPESYFANVTVAPGTNTQQFVVTATGLREKVCNRMGASGADVGAAQDSTGAYIVSAANCATGSVAFTFDR